MGYWPRFGLQRHSGYLDPTRSRSSITAVTAPPGVLVDTIEVQPEAPMGDEAPANILGAPTPDLGNDGSRKPRSGRVGGRLRCVGCPAHTLLSLVTLPRSSPRSRWRVRR